MEKVSFNSEGYKLIGNLHLPLGKKAPCIVSCHGFASSKDSEKWLTFACIAEDAGYAAFRFNFRGCGWGDEWSEGNAEDTTLSNRVKDYRAALDFLENTGKIDLNRLGVIGSSLGGCTIIAANDYRPKVYVALATPYKFPQTTHEMLKSFKEKGYYENPEIEEPRMSRIKQELFDDFKRYDMGVAIKKIKCPILIIHGSKDQIPVSDAYTLYEKANEPKGIEIIEGGSHRFVDTGHLGIITELAIEWFKKYL
jgi:dipeptidyl aminopeptidase/acylaminoacyl peptidase